MYVRYADADPEEFVVVGLGPMTLRTAVRRWIEASRVPGIRLPMIAREAGKDLTTFGLADLDELAEMGGR